MSGLPMLAVFGGAGCGALLRWWLGALLNPVFPTIAMGTLAAIAQKLPDLPAGSRVLGFNYDTGERYLSVEGFLPS